MDVIQDAVRRPREAAKSQFQLQLAQAILTSFGGIDSDRFHLLKWCSHPLR